MKNDVLLKKTIFDVKKNNWIAFTACYCFLRCFCYLLFYCFDWLAIFWGGRLFGARILQRKGKIPDIRIRYPVWSIILFRINMICFCLKSLLFFDEEKMKSSLILKLMTSPDVYAIKKVFSREKEEANKLFAWFEMSKWVFIVWPQRIATHKCFAWQHTWNVSFVGSEMSRVENTCELMTSRLARFMRLFIGVRMMSKRTVLFCEGYCESGSWKYYFECLICILWT